MSTLSRDYEYGRIVSVDVRTLGDNLAADAASGSSTLTVEDAYDFDETGGQLVLGGVVYAYTAVDDETGTITLATVTTAAALEGDAVNVYDPTYATASTEKVAQVEVTGDDGNVDTLECMVALHLTDRLTEGVRGARGESVKLELDGPDWTVVDVYGLDSPDSAGDLFKRDVMTVASTGTQTFTLTYEPIQDSLHLRWEPINMDDTEWSRDGLVVTVPAPNHIRVGDVLTAKYAYIHGVQARLLVEYDALWKYAEGLGGSTSFAASAFDDSAWTEGVAGFGWGGGAAPSWFNTTVASPMDVWARLSARSYGNDLKVSISVDLDGDVYMDGALVASRSGGSPTDFIVPAAAGVHVFAIRGTDADVPDADPATGSFVAVRIEELP